MANQLPDSDVLDAREAAQYLKINEQTVRRLARDSEIPAFKVGGSWRFKRSSLDRWASSQELRQTRRNVLVIDDEEAVRTVLKRALEREEFRVETVASGEEALAKLQDGGPDIIILDLKMPGMDGPEVLRHIREQKEDVPVIILTAYPESTLMERAMQYGPITLLSKPASPDLVVATVRKALPST
ncbi:MAG TPA: response regulator [Acidobacteriota bacterium]|nr:response regulator [Acidobacteriota bacterium]